MVSQVCFGWLVDWLIGLLDDEQISAVDEWVGLHRYVHETRFENEVNGTEGESMEGGMKQVNE